MELVKESVFINESAYTNFSQIPVEGDIIVPDVKPDILKVLQVDSNAVVTGKDIADGKLTINGKVNLKILYVPDKAEERVESINTSIDFVHRVENEAIGQEMQAMVECDIQHVEFRLINSRKMSVSNIVGVDCDICGSKSLEMVTGIDNEDTVEIRKKPISVYNVVAQEEQQFVVKDSVEVPSGKMSIGKVLQVDAKISDKELKVVTGKLIAKGIVCVCILYNGEDGSPEYMEMDIPFTEVFELAGVSEDTSCDMDYTIADMYYETEEDSDGDLRIVNLEFLAEARMRASENVKIDVVDDFYCPGWETKITRESYTIDEVVCQPGTQNTLREIVAMDSGMPQVMNVYNVITKACIKNTSIEKGKLAVEGMVEGYILYLSDSVDSPVYSCKKEIPFSYLIDAPGAETGMECDIKAEVEHSSYSLNMANEVELRCILAINARVMKKTPIDLITDGEICDLEEEKTGIVIYFVQRSDSLWNIARRYHVAIDDILTLNNMQETDKISVGQQLIIPVSHKKTA